LALKTDLLFLAFFRLVRLPNLILVALSLYLTQYVVILPSLEAKKQGPLLTDGPFSLFVMCAVLLTAAGNIINDLYDFELDQHQRPHSMPLGNRISLLGASYLYFMFSVGGFGVAVYLALWAECRAYLFIYPLAAIGLWYYSFRLKGQPLWGNLLVSFYCAALVLAPLLAEWSWVKGRADLSILYAYAVFAFISTLMREIIKDLEDQEGDAKQGLNTLPIAVGEEWARKIVLACGLILLAGIFTFAFWSSALQKWILLLPVLGLLPSIWLSWRANSSQAWHQASLWAKVTMGLGLLAWAWLSMV
jgi:4-hydroxybenzoate polyprenyltransferase